jgi:H/ACA ribonucleoprotein complex subunit 3
MKHIMKCAKCGKYTLKNECCGERTIIPKPAKYSPYDKYARYRRQYKNELENNKTKQ